MSFLPGLLIELIAGAGLTIVAILITACIVFSRDDDVQDNEALPYGERFYE
ncbi:MAG: hypothetical protein WA418_38690 [Bradyrhizobium sp.]